MKAEKLETVDRLRIQAAALRQAARIAALQESPLAAEYWNLACQRIARRLEACAAGLEVDVAESPATPVPAFHIRYRFPSPTNRCRPRRRF